MKIIPFVINGERVSLFCRGKSYQFDKTHVNYRKIISALRDGSSEEDLIELLNSKKVFCQLKGVSFNDDGTILLDGEPMSEGFVRRYRFMLENGFPVSGFQRFVKNVVENPEKEAREDLCEFLEVCDLPITEDGCFLAYKRVNQDYTDVHSRTFSNKVGEVVEMSREECDHDRNVVCSTGLHVCSKAYLSNFKGDRTIVVKVHPKDVVSVPTDYNSSKMRVCRYEVIDELFQTDNTKELGQEINVLAVNTKKPKKIEKKGAKEKETDKSVRFNEYVESHSIGEDLTTLDKKLKDSFRKFCARLLYGGKAAAGSAICGCKTLSSLKKVVLGIE